MSNEKEGTEERTMLETIKDYLNQYIFIDNPAKLERFQDSLPSVCIRGVKEIHKKHQNILGEYTGEMLFGVAIRIGANEDASSAYRLVEDINLFLEQSSVYPIFSNNTVYQNMMMHEHPVLEKVNQDGSEDYIAIFTVEFKKMSNVH